MSSSSYVKRWKLPSTNQVELQKPSKSYQFGNEGSLILIHAILYEVESTITNHSKLLYPCTKLKDFPNTSDKLVEMCMEW